MLVLTRRVGETILIGETIAVTVLEVKGNQVRIGVEAPKEVSIYRKELYLEIVNANKEAVQVDRQHVKSVLSGIRKVSAGDPTVGKGAHHGKVD